MKLLVFWIVVLTSTAAIAVDVREPADINSSDHIFTSDSLPTDDRFMTSVGNGFVATHVFSGNVFMNGLYNGDKRESHRARLPAWCNVRLNSTLEADSLANYTLDARRGVFYTNINNDVAEIEHRLFAHKFYTRAIVNQIVINPTTETPVTVAISLQQGAASNDVAFETATQGVVANRNVWGSCGRTKYVEDVRYQPETSKVCIFWTEVPNSLDVNGSAETFTFVMVADWDEEVALKELTDVLQENPDNLYVNHTSEWELLHQSASIEIEGNLALAKVVNGMFYYLRNSLPSLNANQDQGLYYGLSPTGLSRGGFFKDYQGHSFWDTETWMYPSILVLHPTLAERLLDYRIALLGSAFDRAQEGNYSGARFPWESAYTGVDVTSFCCIDILELEQHITGCIAFAVRQYIAMTGDEDWLVRGGCILARSIAEFWASRVEYNSGTGLYDIKYVIGPDEDHGNVTNNVFTNVIAGLALYLGEYTSCLCGGDPDVAQSWKNIAARLTLLYDPDLDYHPEFEGYERPTTIKQADAVLLGFPLLYKMNESTKANDLEYYESVTRDDGPAMTWSMHTVNHLRLGDNEQATRLFERSYAPYVRDPFKIWTEVIEPDIGSVNFQTGMGGFLQTIIFGYGGLSIYLEKLEILNPQLPPDTTRLKINGIKYLGSVFALDIGESESVLIVSKLNTDRPLTVLIDENVNLFLEENMSVSISMGVKYEIRLVNPGSCPVPDDTIGQTFN